MKHSMFKTTLLSCFMVMGFAFSAQGEEKILMVKSPDNRLEIKVMLGDALKYSVSSHHPGHEPYQGQCAGQREQENRIPALVDNGMGHDAIFVMV